MALLSFTSPWPCALPYVMGSGLTHYLFQAQGDDGPGGVEPEGAGLPSVHHHHRGATGGQYIISDLDH